jgi:hypothetical protein
MSHEPLPNVPYLSDSSMTTDTWAVLDGHLAGGGVPQDRAVLEVASPAGADRVLVADRVPPPGRPRPAAGIGRSGRHCRRPDRPTVRRRGPHAAGRVRAPPQVAARPSPGYPAGMAARPARPTPAHGPARRRWPARTSRRAGEARVPRARAAIRPVPARSTAGSPRRRAGRQRAGRRRCAARTTSSTRSAAVAWTSAITTGHRALAPDSPGLSSCPVPAAATTALAQGR